MSCALNFDRKSQIAIEYCYRYKDANPDHNVFWVHAGTVAKFDQAYKDIAKKRCLPGWSDPQVDTLQLVTAWLDNEDNDHWLLVIDNADDGEIFFGSKSCASWQESKQTTRLFDYLPKGSKGSILITTRDKRVGELLCDKQAAIVIPALDSQSAAAMLRSKVPKDKWQADQAHDLLSLLDNLPLALTQAAAFISDNQITIEAYLEIFRKCKLEAALLLSKDLKDPRRDLDALNSVLQTWKISFDQIREQEPRAAELLSLMAMLDRQGIPKTVLSNKGERTVDLISALGTLQAFSLITAESGGATFEMHRLVQLSTRRWLELQGEVTKWQKKALVKISKVHPPGDYENWTVCEVLSPHAHIVLQYETSQKSYLLQRALLLFNIAWYERSQGHYSIAFKCIEEAYTICEAQLGSTHINTLESANQLAHILYFQGDYDAAEKILRQTLDYRKMVLGLQDTSMLRTMRFLGTVLSHQGRYEAAEQMHRQALEGIEKQLGSQHPDTVDNMNSLALVLSKQGKYDAAEQMLWQVMELQEKQSGSQHPATLVCIDNLGIVLEKQGKYGSAEQMHRQAMKGLEKQLGLQHPDTLMSMSNLGLVLEAQGKHEAAEQMLRQAIEGKEKHLGLQHSSTQTSVYNLAMLLRSQKRYDEAETMLRRALKVAEGTYSLRNLDTLDLVYELASLSYDQGHLNQAIREMRRAHAGYQELFGEDYPMTRLSTGSLSNFLREKADEDKQISVKGDESNEENEEPDDEDEEPVEENKRSDEDEEPDEENEEPDEENEESDEEDAESEEANKESGEDEEMGVKSATILEHTIPVRTL